MAALRAERDGSVAWLRGRGFSVADSDANFVLFGQFADRHAIWQGLLDHGVLVRETGPAGWLRVTIGTPAEMAAFRDALAQVTATAEATGTSGRGLAARTRAAPAGTERPRGGLSDARAPDRLR